MRAPFADLSAKGFGLAGTRVRLAGIGKAVAVFLLVQAVFWVTLSWLERMSQPVGLANGGTVDLVLSDANGEYPPSQPVLQARFDAWPYFFHVDHTRAPTGRFFVRFETPDLDEPIGFYFNPANTVNSVHLNGQLLNARLNYSRWVGVDVFAPTVVILPPELLRAEGNVIQIETETRQRKHLSPFAIGPAADLEQAAAWGALMSTYLPLAALVVMVFTLILCAITYWPKEDRPWINAFMVLLVAWASCNIMALGLLAERMPSSLLLRNLFTWSLVYWYQFAFAAFILHWVKAPKRFQAWVWAGFAVVLALAMVAHFWTDVFDPETGRRVSQELRKVLEHSVTIVMGLGMTIVLLVALVRDQQRRLLETFLFLTGITAITVDSIDDRFRLLTPLFPDLPLTFAIGPAAGLFMALGMCAALARYSADARRVVLTANETLQSRLAQRESELRASHDREQDTLRRAVLLDERQRLVRDMHDGIGGQLLGLSMRVRAGQLDNQGVDQALQTSITDMRLIVDSLDSADEGLAETLQGFAHRAGQQCKAVACQFNWDVAIPSPGPSLGPRATLQILRILQEGLANALRHANPTAISLTATAANGALEIVLQDNGKGLPEGGSTGLGLKNMRARAAAIGAELEIANSGSGARVALKIKHQVAQGTSEA